MDKEQKNEEKKEEEIGKKEPTKEEVSVEEEKVLKTAEKEKEVEVPEKFKNLVSEIEKMSVLDLADFVKVLEAKFGVSAAAPTVAMAAAPGVSPEAAVAEEKTVFDVELTEAGSNKIGVIKAVREVTDLGLKDAKDLVDAAPKIVKEGVKKEEAEEIKKKLEETGAKVTLK